MFSHLWVQYSLFKFSYFTVNGFSFCSNCFCQLDFLCFQQLDIISSSFLLFGLSFIRSRYVTFLFQCFIVASSWSSYVLFSTLRIPSSVCIVSYNIRRATNDSLCRLSTKISLFTEKPLSTLTLPRDSINTNLTMLHSFELSSSVPSKLK